MTTGEINRLSKIVLDGAFEVHRTLGTGLLEAVYEQALIYELHQSGLKVQRQLDLPIQYKNARFDLSYRIDLLVEDALIIELKSVERLEPVHGKQLLTYLKLADKRLGLLINFNVEFLRDGIKRVVNNL